MSLKGSELIEEERVRAELEAKWDGGSIDERRFSLYLCRHILRLRRQLKEETELSERRRKQRNIAVAVGVLLAVALCASLVFGREKPAYYVGSTSSDKYHISSCEYADKIYEGYLIRYDSAEAAERDGRDPCALCLPDK